MHGPLGAMLRNIMLQGGDQGFNLLCWRGRHKPKLIALMGRPPPTNARAKPSSMCAGTRGPIATKKWAYAAA